MSLSNNSTVQGADDIVSGTGTIRVNPYVEPGFDLDGRECLDQYQAISAQSECQDFSLEELRLADYKHGRGVTPAAAVVHSFSSLQLPSSSNRKARLDLLRSPGVEVLVGKSTSLYTETDVHDTWCLPRALISHHSPFFKSACLNNFKERTEKFIALPDDDAQVFALFVEWMYYGDYTIPCWFRGGDDNINMNAKCWVLGDKLLCTQFKNHAMSRLYTQHADGFPATPIKTQDVRFAVDNSVAESKLLSFYLSFMVEHFSNPKRLVGAVEDWNGLLGGCDHLRLVLIENFRKPYQERRVVNAKQFYMDQDTYLSSVLGTMNIGASAKQ